MQTTEPSMSAEQFKAEAGKLSSADKVSLALTAVMARAVVHGSTMDASQMSDLMWAGFEAHRLCVLLDYCAKHIGAAGIAKLSPEFAFDQLQMIAKHRVALDRFRNLFEMGVAAEKKKS